MDQYYLGILTVRGFLDQYYLGILTVRGGFLDPTQGDDGGGDGGDGDGGNIHLNPTPCPHAQGWNIPFG